MTAQSNDFLQQAFESGAEKYFRHCRSNIPHFIKKHYRYPGAWRTNKHAFGFDLVRAPLNLFWAPVYVSIILISLIFTACKLHRIGAFLRSTPSGLTTMVQRHINQKISTELLHSDHSGSPYSLRSFIADEIKLIAVDEDDSDMLQLQDFHNRLNEIIDESLEQLTLTRTASADITNTLFSTTFGALAFKKFTPGGIGIGFLLAGYYAHIQAKSNFIFGEALGGFYYSIFPPKPSLFMMLASVIFVMFIFSIFASFSGLITDPIQSHLRIHKHRLHKLIDALVLDFKQKTSGGFKPKDSYVARLFEALDMLRAQINL